MVFLNLNKRLQDLENNITQDLELLEECEEALRNEHKPRIKRYYRSEIERQKESVNDYEKQYSKLRQELADEPTARIQTVEKQLQSLNDKVNVLLSSQLAIYQDLNHMRQTLLERYDEGEQAIITAIAQQLNECLHLAHLLWLTLLLFLTRKTPQLQCCHHPRTCHSSDRHCHS